MRRRHHPWTSTFSPHPSSSSSSQRETRGEAYPTRSRRARRPCRVGGGRGAPTHGVAVCRACRRVEPRTYTPSPRTRYIVFTRTSMRSVGPRKHRKSTVNLKRPRRHIATLAAAADDDDDDDGDRDRTQRCVCYHHLVASVCAAATHARPSARDSSSSPWAPPRGRPRVVLVVLVRRRGVERIKTQTIELTIKRRWFGELRVDR